MREKMWFIINVSLFLVIFLLFLNLFSFKIPTLGDAKSFLVKEKPLCVVNWDENYNSWNDLDGCCLEARAQFRCVNENLKLKEGDLDWVCYTGSGKVLRYWLNDEAMNYCRKQSFWG